MGILKPVMGANTRRLYLAVGKPMSYCLKDGQGGKAMAHNAYKLRK